MAVREKALGKTASFLLPSLKLKYPGGRKASPEAELHSFLMENFGGYTAQAGNIFGYWRDKDGKDSYGEHREFSVACNDVSKLEALKDFLSGMARQLNEESIYFRNGTEAALIFPKDRAPG